MDMPLTDQAWRLIVDATPGGVQGKAFWMSRRTWVALLHERTRRTRPGSLYSVPVLFDDSMILGTIRLERRNSR
jgi:hypothetical protein